MDALGNHSTTQGPSGLVTSFSFSGNRIANSGVNYDADGNLLDDPLLTSQANAFDAEGKPVTFEGVAVTFDALGRAVEASITDGATTEFVYGPDGGKLAVMSGQTLVRADIPLPGGGEAVYHANGFAYYRHGDWLGSAALSADAAGTLDSSTRYSPYGADETRAGYRGGALGGISVSISDASAPAQLGGTAVDLGGSLGPVGFDAGLGLEQKQPRCSKGDIPHAAFPSRKAARCSPAAYHTKAAFALVWQGSATLGLGLGGRGAAGTMAVTTITPICGSGQ